MAKQVLFVVTSHEDLGTTGKKTGWYLPEVAHPYYVFKSAGLSMTIVSPKGGKAPMDPGSAEAFKDDPVSQKLLKDTEAMALLNNTKRIDSVNPKDFNAIFYAGGHGPMFDLPENAESNKVAAAIYEAGGIVSAVCHGPAGICNVQLSDESYLVTGKSVTGFTNEEEEAVKLTEQMPFLLETRLRERGANFVDGGKFQPNVQVSERLITGQNPPSATPMAEAVVKQLK